MKKVGPRFREGTWNSWRPSWSARRKCVRQFVWFVAAAPAASLICHAIIFESQTSSICTHAAARLYNNCTCEISHALAHRQLSVRAPQAAKANKKERPKLFGAAIDRVEKSAVRRVMDLLGCQCYEVSSHFFFCYGSVLIAPQQCVARVCTFWWKRRTKSERRRAAQVRWAAIELGNFYYFMFARTIISELTAEGWVFLFSLNKISLSACSHFACISKNLFKTLLWRYTLFAIWRAMRARYIISSHFLRLHRPRLHNAKTLVQFLQCVLALKRDNLRRETGSFAILPVRRERKSALISLCSGPIRRARWKLSRL